MSNYLGWSNAQIEDLVNRVYGGVVTRKNLPKDLYLAIVARLEQAVVEGMGEALIESEIAVGFRTNLAVFSAAKTYQQVNDMSNFLLDADGNKRAFNEFKEAADQIFDAYNDNWLKTEYNTAFAKSQAAADWVKIEEQAEALPLLKYSTVGDERVRQHHVELDGIIRPVNDAFWSTYYPPNDWNCRCIVEQLDEGDITDISGKTFDKPDKLFANNPAKTKTIFDEKAHPYFKVADKYKIEKLTD